MNNERINYLLELLNNLKELQNNGSIYNKEINAVVKALLLELNIPLNRGIVVTGKDSKMELTENGIEITKIVK